MAAREIKTTLALDGEQAFKRGMDEAYRAMKVLGSELKINTAEFGRNATSLEGLTQRGAILRKEYEQQQKIVQALAKAVEESAAAYGETDKRTDQYRVKLNNATAALTKMESELNANETAISNFGGKTEDAEKKTTKWEDALKKVAETLGKGIVKASKAAAVAVGAMAVAAGAAAVKLGSAVVKSFGELEQNLGGADAVFEQYSDQMKAYGEEAYKTMGATQSEYLATANKMGSLFQGSGLSVQRSMELTSSAMQRAADMASVMGIDTQTALDSIAGAAKGNFTMMDNLGVAMNATTLEAYALSKGLKFTWNTASSADKAELAMQMFFEKTQQYAGNFAKEAEGTISGSIGMMKAATSSFIAGLGNSNADMTALTQNMVNSLNAVITNITPVLQNIVTSLPAVVDTVVQSIGTMLPMLVTTMTDMFTQVLTLLVSLLPQLTPVAIDAILTITQALMENLPMILTAAGQLINGLLTGIQQALPQLIPAAVQGITTFANGLIQGLPQILQAGIDILLKLVEGITQSLPQLIPAAVQGIVTIVTGLTNNLPKIISAGIDIIVALVKGFIDALPEIIDAMPEIIAAFVNAVTDNLPKIIASGIQIIISLAGGLIQAIPQLVSKIPQIISSIVGGLRNGLSSIFNVGIDMVKGLWEGIKSMTSWLWDKLTGWIGDALGWIADLLGIKSPSRVMADRIGKPMAQGVAVGILSQKGSVQDALESIIPSTRELNLDANVTGFAAASRRAVAGVSTPSVGAVNLSEASIVQLAREIRNIMTDKGDIVLTMNDREMGRWVRKVALA